MRRHAALLALAPLVALCGCAPRAIVTEAVGEAAVLDAASPDASLDVTFCYDGRPLSWVDSSFARLELDLESEADLGGLSIEIMIEGEEEARVFELPTDPSTLVWIDEMIFEAGGCSGAQAITLTLTGDIADRSVTVTPVMSVDLEYIIEGGSFFALADDALEIRLE